MIKSMAVCDSCSAVISTIGEGVVVEGNIYALGNSSEDGMKGGGLVGNAFSEDGKVLNVFHYHKSCLKRILNGGSDTVSRY